MVLRHIRTSYNCIVEQLGRMDEHLRHHYMPSVLWLAECDLDSVELIEKVLFYFVGKKERISKVDGYLDWLSRCADEISQGQDVRCTGDRDSNRMDVNP